MTDVRKLFEPTGRLRLFRFLRSGRMGDMDASVHADSTEDREQTKTLSPDAYLLAKNRNHEIEAQKAVVLFESRHDKWKSRSTLSVRAKHRPVSDFSQVYFRHVRIQAKVLERAINI